MENLGWNLPEKHDSECTCEYCIDERNDALLSDNDDLRSKIESLEVEKDSFVYCIEKLRLKLEEYQKLIKITTDSFMYIKGLMRWRKYPEEVPEEQTLCQVLYSKDLDPDHVIFFNVVDGWEVKRDPKYWRPIGELPWSE